jgi:hypothetical protein
LSRPDLLALSADDLAALTNRGTLKRARRDLDEGECTCTNFSEAEDGSVSARWSDGVECRLPAGAVLGRAHCSCGALPPCRHLVRTVLAYQRRAAEAAPPAAVEPWDPGGFSDEDLARHYRAQALARARERFAAGVLVELVRSAKPSAHFHVPPCTLRFLVPGDLRYANCDCAEPAPCSHVPLAVWAFRLLEPSRTAGILASGEKGPAVPADLLDELEAGALALAEQGISGAGAAWIGQVTRLENRCRQADLVWPAEVLADLARQQERYAAHDARFAPERVADLVGELLIRADALRHDTGALPRLLVGGTSADRPTPLGAARFVGLGCGVRLGRRSVELAACLQDAGSGNVVAVTKEVVEAEPDPARPAPPFGDLAQARAVKEYSFATLGCGQLLLDGGKRTPSFELLVGRARATVQPQAFAWEGLRPPALVEDFAELDARLSGLPPASLRPRRLAEDFHVCPLVGAEAVRFDPTTQAVQAVVLDGRGRRALLVHPYTTRGRVGAEVLLSRLQSAPGEVRFAAGPVRRGPAGLVIHPVCVVWQEGAARTAVQPWVERQPGGEGAPAPSPAGDLSRRPEGARDPLSDHLGQLQSALGELLVLGVQRADAQAARRWRELQRQGEAAGLGRLARRVAGLADSLGQKGHTPRWDWQPAGRALLELAVLVRLAQDLAST